MLEIWKEDGKVYVEGKLVDYSGDFEKDRGIARKGVLHNIERLLSHDVQISRNQSLFGVGLTDNEVYGFLISLDDRKDGLYAKGILRGAMWESLASKGKLLYPATFSYGFRESSEGMFDLFSVEIIIEPTQK